MGKAQIEIGKRAAEEISRLYNTAKEIDFALSGGTTNGLHNAWQSGVAPSARYLQRMYYLGADVLYILTGRRGLYELPKVQESKHKGDRNHKWFEQ